MKALLSKYDENKVDIFIAYINNLKTETDKEGKLKNYWARNTKDEDYINAFKKVYETGLYIDGDSVTLTFRGKLLITYDYHAYKNKILLSYPESIFDFQVVYEGDDFAFRKESGKVYYTHKMNNPFQVKKDITGAYGVLKNKKGEFIELINTDDIQKMKNTSKMKNIWDAWFDRMVLKSVIKRICSVHFKDITKDIDSIDNELNDPDRATIDELILTDIDNAETEEQLGKIYKNSIGSIKDKEQFIKLLAKRKEEVLK
jgi:hypothetical protein